METNFVKTRTFSDYIITSALILLGLILIVLSDSSSMIIAGAMIIITGFILFFTLKSAWKDASTGDMYQGKVLYYNRSKKNALLDALRKNLAEVSDIEVEESAQKSLRLDVYYSQDVNKIYFQLFEYVPYEYKPITSLDCSCLEEVRSKLK